MQGFLRPSKSLEKRLKKRRWLYERDNGSSREDTDEKMALKEIPTVDDLVETTGQSKEQLLKDREAAVKMSPRSDEE